MAWVLPTIAAVGALGSAAINASGRSNGQAIQQSGISNQALGVAQNNMQQMALLQALINRRSVAGSVDEAGTSMRYDPATNQWVSQLGKLPGQVQTASDQASVSRNTTDLRQAQAANEQAAIRASRGEGYADTARRELESFRPRGHDEMVGLLGEQATRASNNTFRPLVADTLRSFARTGTSAGPVLAEIGRSSAGNLRDSLMEAQIKGMSSADQMNEGRRQSLTGAAQAGGALATPGFGYSQLNPSSYASTMANLLGQRAHTATVAPAYGISGMGTAAKGVQDAYGTAAKAVPDPNFSTAQSKSALDSLSTAAGKGGALSELYNVWKSSPKSESSLWGSQGEFGPVTQDYNFG